MELYPPGYFYNYRFGKAPRRGPFCLKVGPSTGSWIASAPEWTFSPTEGVWNHRDGRAIIPSQTFPNTWDRLVGGRGAGAKPFSVSCWFRAITRGTGGGSNNQGTLWSFGNQDRWLRFSGATDDDILQLRFSIPGSVSSGQVETSIVGLNRWYHIVATYTGGNAGLMQLYVDGALDTQYTWNAIQENYTGGAPAYSSGSFANDVLYGIPYYGNGVAGSDFGPTQREPPHSVPARGPEFQREMSAQAHPHSANHEGGEFSNGNA